MHLNSVQDTRNGNASRLAGVAQLPGRKAIQQVPDLVQHLMARLFTHLSKMLDERPGAPCLLPLLQSGILGYVVEFGYYDQQLYWVGAGIVGRDKQSGEEPARTKQIGAFCSQATPINNKGKAPGPRLHPLVRNAPVLIVRDA